MAKQRPAWIVSIVAKVLRIKIVQDKLVIYLHNDETEPPDWVVLNAENIFRYSVRHGSPADLTDAALDKEIIVIIPAEDILITAAALPKMNRSRLAQALPFALEEQLIGEVGTLHFAQGDRQADEGLPVAVVSREKMQAWIALLQSWDIEADRMVPSALALPVAENTWHVAINGMATVRTSLYQGFVADKNNLQEMLAIALASATASPAVLQISNYSTQPVAETLSLPLGINEAFKEAEQLSVDMAKEAVRLPAINLLQGPYRSTKSRYPQMHKIGKVASCLVVVWVILLFIYPTVSYFILKHRVSSIDSQVQQIYKRNFPLSTSVVAPKMRMEEKLRKFTAQAGDSKLFFLLGYVGKGILEKPSIKLKRFDFQNNQLTLELTTASSDDFTTFTDFLSRQGLNVKQQNANMVGARINGIVVVE
jgi:general secretion pathway protein L